MNKLQKSRKFSKVVLHYNCNFFNQQMGQNFGGEKNSQFKKKRRKLNSLIFNNSFENVKYVKIKK